MLQYYELDVLTWALQSIGVHQKGNFVYLLELFYR